MSDIADLATDLSEKLLEQALLKAETKRKQDAAHLMAFRGICLNCESPIDTGTVCDVHCREDYEKRTRK